MRDIPSAQKKPQLALKPKLLKLAEFGVHRGENVVGGLGGMPLHNQPVQPGLLLIDARLGVSNELIRVPGLPLRHVATPLRATTRREVDGSIVPVA